RDATKRHVFETWTACRVRSFADYLRGMWPHVEAALAKPVPCSRCGAPLAPAKRNQSESISCGHCGAANLFAPDPLVTQWFTYAPQSLAAEQCLGKSLALLRANEDVQAWIEAEYRRSRQRPEETQASKQGRRAMADDYYRAFIAAKARMLGTP